ncbi:MAG TPA: flagellar hook assembly protein FlgD, partial [Alphaproteobacteria bacterium]|nr:flagellar hook assembly protein FlgD [Alphaproteobacteria bacterium]
PPAGTTGANPMDSLSQDYTTFLKLLTTQLQNQDPLSPMDSSQFTNQLVQFASVEQQIKANTNLTSLISLQQAGAAQQALSYLGKVGEINASELPLVNDRGAFSYTLSGPANNVEIDIADKDGKIVRTVAGSTATGKHVITWDGTDNGGTALPDGLYTVTVKPTRFDDTKVTASTTVYGVINGVQTDTTGTTSLNMTYLSVTPDKLLTVNQSIGGSTQSIATAPKTTANDNTDTSGTSGATGTSGT